VPLDVRFSTDRCIFSALRDTAMALKAAAEITYDPSAPFKLPEVSPVFDTARASIKQCFESYEVSFHDARTGKTELRKDISE
jgi:hypothetical protein